MIGGRLILLYYRNIIIDSPGFLAGVFYFSVRDTPILAADTPFLMVFFLVIIID